MISEELKPEDWSNDAENSVLLHRNKLHFTIFKLKTYFKLLFIFPFLLYF